MKKSYFQSQSGGSSGLDIDTEAYKPSTGDMPGKVESTASTILGILTIVGAIATVILLALLGVGIMFGSAEQRAIDQQKIITFLIGAVLVTGGSAIVKFIVNNVGQW